MYFSSFNILNNLYSCKKTTNSRNKFWTWIYYLRTWYSSFIVSLLKLVEKIFNRDYLYYISYNSNEHSNAEVFKFWK